MKAVGLMLSRGNLYVEKNTATKFCHLALGNPVIRPLPHLVCTMYVPMRGLTVVDAQKPVVDLLF